VAAVAADVATATRCRDLARIAEPFGPPDILCMPPGINTREPADDVTPEGWDMTLAST
jgi:hypothetical protein